MFYVKALHIIFIVTWFSGLFYIVRLFIYTAEANEKIEPDRTILVNQLLLMQKRLWYIITWPSAILTAIFGTWIWQLYGSFPPWLQVKLVFVVALFLYHFSLHHIFNQQGKGIFKYSSQQLRLWNELATIFLIAIVMLATVKNLLSAMWGIIGIIALIIILFIAVTLYKKARNDNGKLPK